TLPAANLQLASTAHLTQNFVSEFPLTFIPLGSMKLSVKYSMLVSLRGVDETEYNYWQQIQKTTENIGGLYDPLPAQVLGNLHNDANASEKVLGYFSGGGIKEKRIYISFYDLPESLRWVSRGFCPLDTLKPIDLKNSHGLLIVNILPNGAGYLYSNVDCVDCRFAGGVTTKPTFWP
ncbi:MAG TPA: DUF4249 family protein, partial [Cyclobacteriaceae bacterium]|nr:DUF4249 family protein [Cyclobacteriaceae bacterium]